MRSKALRFVAACVCLAAGSIASSTVGDEGVRSKLMTGRWRTVAIENGTAKIEGPAAAAAMPAELQFGDGTIALFHREERIAEASYVIDETVEPDRMTIETTVPRASLPGNRDRIVSFCVDGVCYSMGIEDAPKELFPDPKVTTTVTFRIVDDRLEMTGTPTGSVLALCCCEPALFAPL